LQLVSQQMMKQAGSSAGAYQLRAGVAMYILRCMCSCWLPPSCQFAARFALYTNTMYLPLPQVGAGVLHGVLQAPGQAFKESDT